MSLNTKLTDLELDLVEQCFEAIINRLPVGFLCFFGVQ